MRGLYSEGNLSFKIDWGGFIVGSKFTVFALFYFVFGGLILIWRDDLTEGFLRYRFGGIIFGGAYFRNFRVLSLPCFIFSLCIFGKFSNRPRHTHTTGTTVPFYGVSWSLAVQVTTTILTEHYTTKAIVVQSKS